MSSKKQFTTEQARETGHKLNIDWSRFDVEQFLWVWMLSWSMAW